MYQTLVFAVVTSVLLCAVPVTISKPLAEEPKLFLIRENEDLNVEGLFGDAKSTTAHDKAIETLGKIVPIKKIVIKSEVSKEALNDRYLDSDTKKHYYLFKVREYYDFLPLYRQNTDRFSGLEIVDRSDIGYSNGDETIGSKDLVKRSVSVDDSVNKWEATNDVNGQNLALAKQRGFSDKTLRDFLNVLQTNFVKRRHVNNVPMHNTSEDSSLRAKRDLGNFYLDKDFLSGDNPDDPQNNNNYKYVAYVPFFRVQKYYLHRKRLDIGD